MDLVSDPYHDAHKEVEHLLQQGDALLVRLQELEHLRQSTVLIPPTSSHQSQRQPKNSSSSSNSKPATSQVEDEIQWDFQELAGCAADVQESLKILGVAVAVAEKKAATFKVDAAELGRRKEYIQSAFTKLSQLEEAAVATAARLNFSDSWAKLRLKATSPTTTAATTPADPIDSLKVSLGSGGGGATKRQPRPSSSSSHSSHPLEEDDLEEFNSPHDYIGEALAKQELLMKQQDDQLDQLHDGVRRLAHLGSAMQGELASQHRLLDDVDTAATTLQIKLRHVQRGVAAATRAMTQRGSKVCLILVIMALAIILLYLLYG